MRLRLIFAALLFSVLFSAQHIIISTQAAPVIPAPGTTIAELLMVVADNNQGASFLREAQPILERLQARVRSVKQVFNPALGREETMIALSFDSVEGANSFMRTLSGSEPGDGDTSGSSHHCETGHGTSKVCYFFFGDYRFVCVTMEGATRGSCAQY